MKCFRKKTPKQITKDPKECEHDWSEWIHYRDGFERSLFGGWAIVWQIRRCKKCGFEQLYRTTL